MVGKLKVALDRHRGVDHEAIKLKSQLKQKRKEKGRNRSNKKPKLDIQGQNKAAVEGLSKPRKNGAKVAAEAIEESEDESEHETEDEDFQIVDEDDEDAEDDFDGFDDSGENTSPIIDTSKLEDDLSSDSESDEEEDTMPELTPKKADIGLSKPEEEEEDIPLSDLPTDSESEDERGEAIDIIPHQKLTVNNVKALKHSLSTIELPISSYAFNDHMTVTSDEPTAVSDANDDLTRELAFYNQALAAATKGRSALLKEKVPFSRPEDYFAEMLKSDSHMEKLARHHSSDRSSVIKGNSKNKSKGKNKKK
ncbi:eukaryotic rRNA processing protein EBP2-domain-containing protein [Lipomyces kononenkoae]|uniref:Eukaryotic rRNA processing protein EBP2-domain-containing protein n=1 Tax=Lipomyces kononenkoae TaxID=34357 RepID=A0ACC3T6X5_LIPKO